MKRETLTRNLKCLVERINNLTLPVEIQKVFIHGSYIRGDETPGDLDIVLPVNVKPEWSRWYESFSSLRDRHDLVIECYKKDMSFKDAVYGPLASEIERRGIPLEWVATMNWSEIFGGNAPYLSYSLDWEKITNRLLTKGMLGVHIQIENRSFEEITPIIGRLHIYREMPVYLIWTLESPEDCILKPTREEYAAYLKMENEHLLENTADAQLRVKLGRLLIEKSLPHVPKAKWAEVALQVLSSTPKYEAEENALRELLREFGIPEQKVYALRRRGSKTSYDLPKTLGEEAKLRKLVKTWDAENRAELRVLKLVRKFVPKTEASKIDCWVKDLKTGRVELTVKKPAELDTQSFQQIWSSRGFEIQQTFGSVYGEKTLLISLNLNEIGLLEEIKKSLQGE
jgi:predicted nucleotidyltransferase